MLLSSFVLAVERRFFDSIVRLAKEIVMFIISLFVLLSACVQAAQQDHLAEVKILEEELEESRLSCKRRKLEYEEQIDALREDIMQEKDLAKKEKYREFIADLQQEMLDDAKELDYLEDDLIELKEKAGKNIFEDILGAR